MSFKKWFGSVLSLLALIYLTATPAEAGTAFGGGASFGNSTAGMSGGGFVPGGGGVFPFFGGGSVFGYPSYSVEQTFVLPPPPPPQQQFGPLELTNTQPFATTTVEGSREVSVGDNLTRVRGPMVVEYSWPQSPSGLASPGMRHY
jgi:hypothetical protein